MWHNSIGAFLCGLAGYGQWDCGDKMLCSSAVQYIDSMLSDPTIFSDFSFGSNTSKKAKSK